MVVPSSSVAAPTDWTLLITIASVLPTVVIVVGFLMALRIVLRDTTPVERPGILRALAAILRGRIPPTRGL